MELKQRLTSLVLAIQKLDKECYPDYQFKIGYLTIFARNEADYSESRTILSQLGKVSPANNGVAFEMETPLEIEGEKIANIRIRKPDVHRPELGCGDLIYTPGDYAMLRQQALGKGLDIILRKKYEMIELSTFTIPAYAYLIPEDAKI